MNLGNQRWFAYNFQVTVGIRQWSGLETNCFFFFFFLCSVRSSKYLFSLKQNLSCLIIFHPLRFFLLCSRDKEYQKFLALKSRNISQSSTVHIRTILVPPSRAKLQIVWYFRRKYMLIIIIYSLFNNFPQNYWLWWSGVNQNI